jgi:hypothetical protein
MDDLVSVRGNSGIKELLIRLPRPGDFPATFTIARQLGIVDLDWQSLISAGSVVCAKAPNGAVVGLQIANHYFFLHRDERIRPLRAALNVLCNRFKLTEASIVFGSQAVIVPEFCESDLRDHLLRSLLRSIGFRYRHLFSMCRKDDPIELQTLQLQGWRCFQEEDDVCYLMLDVAKALRGLASQIVLRMPPRPAQTVARAAGTQ